MQSSSQITTTNKPSPNFLQAGCPSCHPDNSVKTLKGFSNDDIEGVFSNFWLLAEQNLEHTETRMTLSRAHKGKDKGSSLDIAQHTSYNPGQRCFTTLEVAAGWH